MGSCQKVNSPELQFNCIITFHLLLIFPVSPRLKLSSQQIFAAMYPLFSRINLYLEKQNMNPFLQQPTGEGKQWLAIPVYPLPAHSRAESFICTITVDYVPPYFNLNVCKYGDSMNGSI